MKAMKQLDLREGLIVTESERAPLEQDDCTIRLIPFYEFALDVQSIRPM